VNGNAVKGITLGFRFAPGIGLPNGVVKAGNILFDARRRIQIADVSLILFATGARWTLVGEYCTPTIQTHSVESSNFSANSDSLCFL
jgi:hypothetical protein